MAKALSTFDTIALESSIREHPADRTAQGAYYDALQEAGHSAIRAKAIVRRVVREATEARQCERVVAYLTGKGPGPTYVRRYVKQVAGYGHTNPIPLKVVPGGERPRGVMGMEWYTDEDGKVYTTVTPADILTHFFVWHHTRDEVVVGAAWIVQACQPECTWLGFPI